MTRPLDGTLVVSLDQAVAAPMTARRLADAGARVIKLERPEGDFARYYDDIVQGQCTHYVWLNRGKELVVADLTKPDDRRLFEAMLAKADVFLQNLKPGALAKLGYPVEALREKHQGLICCSISGYGDDGPYRDRKAYDLLIQAESGLGFHHRRTRRRRRASASPWWTSARDCTRTKRSSKRSLHAGATGKGADIRVSMFDSMMEWMAIPLLFGEYGDPPKRAWASRISASRPTGCSDPGWQPDPHLGSERSRVGRFLQQGAGPAGVGHAIRASPPILVRVANRPETDALIGRYLRHAAMSQALSQRARCRARSHSRASTMSSACCGTRICDA